VRLRLALALPAALLAAGCGSSPPSHFFVLTAEPGPAALAPRAAITTVMLGRIGLPGALDRPQLARRRGGYEIVFSEEERWAGPFDDMLRRVLADDLAARLPPGWAFAASGPQAAAVTIALDISRFDADEQGAVTLVAHWQMLGRNGAPLGPARESTIVEPGAGAGGAAIAAAMSRAVAQLAARIAAGLR
jgi:uncharacterized protein